MQYEKCVKRNDKNARSRKEEFRTTTAATRKRPADQKKRRQLGAAFLLNEAQAGSLRRMAARPAKPKPTSATLPGSGMVTGGMTQLGGSPIVPGGHTLVALPVFRYHHSSKPSAVEALPPACPKAVAKTMRASSATPEKKLVGIRTERSNPLPLPE